MKRDTIEMNWKESGWFSAWLALARREVPIAANAGLGEDKGTSAEAEQRVAHHSQRAVWSVSLDPLAVTPLAVGAAARKEEPVRGQ